jgi:hypothetical protein
MTIASVNYEVGTDSWWCALAACAVLFGILGRLLAGETGTAIPSAAPRPRRPPGVDGRAMDGRAA